MAGPKQRGRGKKRTYAKKDPTRIRSWDEYWKKKEKKQGLKYWNPDATEEQIRREEERDKKWDKKQRLGGIEAGFYDYEGETDLPYGFYRGDRAIGKFESDKNQWIPDMRDYRNTMSMQDIMGVPPSITMSDPAQQAFREEGFDRYTQELKDREKRGIDWQKFRNQMDFKNMIIDRGFDPESFVESDSGNWGTYSPSTGITTLNPDIFAHGNPARTVWHEYLHDRGLGERAVRDIIEQEVPDHEHSVYSEEDLRERTDEEWEEIYRKLGATGPEDEPFYRGPKGPPPKSKGKLRAILEGLGSFFKEKFN